MAHGLSCSAACGIFPDQGSNPCPLHWQEDSQPLHHQGSPEKECFALSFSVELRSQIQLTLSEPQFPKRSSNNCTFSYESGSKFVLRHFSLFYPRESMIHFGPKHVRISEEFRKAFVSEKNLCSPLCLAGHNCSLVVCLV